MRIRTLAVACLTLGISLLLVAPAGADETLAPQPIDATTQGGLAFVAFAIMVFIFAGSLFFMDAIRKRKMDE